jgi:hypothetical protein
MIKLIDIINEVEDDIQAKLQAARAAVEPTKTRNSLAFSDEELKQGFKKDPRTGDIQYVPKIVNIKSQLMKYKKEIRPFTYDDDEKIEAYSKEICKNLNIMDSMLSTLRDLIELKKRSIK